MSRETYFCINFLWNSERKRSLTNSPFLGLSLWPAVWFLKMRSSSQRRLTANVEVDVVLAAEGVWPSAAWRLRSGLPVAISASRSASVFSFASAS